MIGKATLRSTPGLLKGAMILSGLFMLGCKRPAEAPMNPTDTSAITQPNPDNYKTKTLEKMQGDWVHTEDSLTAVSIMGNSWFFEYTGIDTVEYDSFRIEFTDTITPLVKKDERVVFLLLKSKDEELTYEVVTLTDSIMNLMYYPRGNTQIYKRAN